MVGHTGVWDATVAAVETVDACLARIVAALEAVDAADPDGPGRRCWSSPPTTATPTRCATRTANPVTAHSLNPVPIVLAGRAVARPDACATASSPTSRRRSRARRAAAVAGDDRPLAARSRVARTAAASRAPVLPSAAVRPRRSSRVNPFLAIGQIIVSIALIAAILLQARGTGLSGTFGGDSAVYRSRRGIERRLWQFTIVLLVLFVAVLAGVVHLRARHGGLSG